MEILMSSISDVVIGTVLAMVALVVMAIVLPKNEDKEQRR